MLKVQPPDGYPPEEGRYVRGNDYSPVAVCVILDTFDFAIPTELNELVMAGVDSGAALSGMLQTENIGLEKMICNIVANPNIRYVVLCGRESAGHLPGESLLALKENGVSDTKQIIGTSAPTPNLYNIPWELIERFREKIASIVNLLCQPGERDITMPGLDPKVMEKAVRSCYQEEPVLFMGYRLHDIGAYSEPAISHRIASKLSQPQQDILQPGKSKLAAGLVLHKLLPKTNCRKCGRRTCLAFAIELAKGRCRLEECPILDQPEFAADRQALAKLLEQ
ncbi:MAG: tetrahydromethanopterin S-methyltransferase subunit A [Dehalococcoidia bacterium]|nr:tetrahydromethanopterin S-methyltransferase subunit A [Dehalococcoidia bacterium]